MDINNLKKEYTNGEVTIVWQSGLCHHAGECVKHLPEVFKPREKPWINPENGSTEQIINAVTKCPSGALTFYMNSDKDE